MRECHRLLAGIRPEPEFERHHPGLPSQIAVAVIAYPRIEIAVSKLDQRLFLAQQPLEFVAARVG